ncbi:MAG: hypothetical protein EOQ55_27135 [Mesorhizobium sp.]|uniref:hypothetical protein n=1 Tax=Mesorhizobium sp. TaxID=1871066 RepID=UPI000FE65DED|nr:hypothetical protein [Mesorhizobium sp.]RWG12332.1 MAG: hypothetical protein EOQ55_27135 [Mesorhizobium sp.]
MATRAKKQHIPLVSLGWWSESETPRWVLAGSAVLTILASAWVSYQAGEHSRHNAERSAQIQALLDSTREFQVYASAFSTEMFADRAVTTPTRSKLIENLNDQFSRLRAAEPIIPPDAKPDAEAYKQKILTMTDAVNNTVDLMSMKNFWTAAGDLTDARKKLNAKLNTAI